MPKIKPSSGEVDWPEEEGVLGIVGVAPWATIEFCKLFYGRIKASKDWHYPRVLIDVNTKLPSRGRHFQLGEADPSPYIAETIRELHAQGATVVVVPCNTAHILYDRWAKGAQVSVPHIVHETLSQAKWAGVNCITPFTSSSLAEHDLFGSLAEEQGFQCRRLNRLDQDLVSRMIEDVKKHGIITAPVLAEFDVLVKKLRDGGVEAAVIGCTELSVLLKRFAINELLAFDSNEALAKAALKALCLPMDLLI